MFIQYIYDHKMYLLGVRRQMFLLFPIYLYRFLYLFMNKDSLLARFCLVISSPLTGYNKQLC